jgi:hypothetical protein
MCAPLWYAVRIEPIRRAFLAAQAWYFQSFPAILVRFAGESSAYRQGLRDILGEEQRKMPRKGKVSRLEKEKARLEK